MTWTRLPVLAEREAGLRSGCSTCGPIDVELPMEALILVGLGEARVTRDGVDIWRQTAADDEDTVWTAGDAEAAAARDPDCDYRILLLGPLSELEYQRQWVGRWLLVRRGPGFTWEPPEFQPGFREMSPLARARYVYRAVRLPRSPDC